MEQSRVVPCALSAQTLPQEAYGGSGGVHLRNTMIHIQTSYPSVHSVPDVEDVVHTSQKKFTSS